MNYLFRRDCFKLLLCSVRSFPTIKFFDEDQDWSSRCWTDWAISDLRKSNTVILLTLGDDYILLSGGYLPDRISQLYRA